MNGFYRGEAFQVTACGEVETSEAFMKAARRQDQRANVRKSKDNVRQLRSSRKWGAMGFD